jgi:hypothetical protein
MLILRCIAITLAWVVLASVEPSGFVATQLVITLALGLGVVTGHAVTMVALH